LDYNIVYKPMDVICRQGDPSSDLYLLKEGRLLICTVQGTHVKVLARIEPGEFIGELSFFDGNPRSSHIIALERSIVTSFPKDEIMEHLPFWFIEVGKNLTKKIRHLDAIIHESNFKKIGSEDQKPLSIDEQRQVLTALNK
jgi:CRP/FNR family cyclic AMP-dependent transcriptional regulator